MSELYEKSLIKLELPLVLDLLSACASSQGGKDACLRLKPISDAEEVNLLLEQTSAASALCMKKGNPVFGDITDVSASLERADMGGCLQPVELLRIGAVLRSARTIKGYISDDDAPTVLDSLFRSLTPNKYLDALLGIDYTVTAELAENYAFAKNLSFSGYDGSEYGGNYYNICFSVYYPEW